MSAERGTPESAAGPEESPGNDPAPPGKADELARANAALHSEIAVRRQAEEDLKQKDRFLESVIDNVPDMIFVKDARELRFVRFNRAGEELLGHRREDLLGKNDYDFFPKEEADAFTANDRAVLASGALLEIPSEPIHTRAKGLRWLHTKKIPIRGENGEPLYLLGISEDITEKKQAEEDKRRAEEELAKRAVELARSNEELEQFAYVASHDLQEPLRKIQAFSNLLTMTCGPVLGPEGSDYAARILGAASRMRTLIQDLLALSHVTSQARPFVAVDLEGIAHDTLADLEVQIAESGAEVIVRDLPVVHADPSQMRQLFQNLIGNALKFRPSHEPPWIMVSARREGDRVEVAIEDHGIGFDEKYADRIFKPFQRLHSRDRYPGTGIGLAICRKIVQRHGGELRVTSAPGHGTTFLATLPAGPDAGGKHDGEREAR
jgi:PAS domain S-box-containing protein